MLHFLNNIVIIILFSNKKIVRNKIRRNGSVLFLPISLKYYKGRKTEEPLAYYSQVCSSHGLGAHNKK